MLSLSRYQWTVVFAAWLGWGFDQFDGILFNFVAPNCVPTLLGLAIDSPEAKSATFYWTGVMSSVLLLGWAVGGVIFGAMADRIGRSKTLLLTMVLFAVGTASCAFATNIWVLMLCRIIASLGIGGEWAAGVVMVAEAVPEKYRVTAGILLQTSSPFCAFLASAVNYLIAGVLLLESPETSWRYVFLCGLIPAAVALIVRIFLKEPERWQKAASQADPPKISELFDREYLPATVGGFLLALIALLTWWSCQSFIPVISTGLAQSVALERGLDEAATLSLVEQWKVLANNSFNIGGLIGFLLTIPASKFLGRKQMFSVYFLLSTVVLLIDFGLSLPPEVHLYFYFFIGLTVTGVFGTFSFYLPELFPTRLRATGAGFCYNFGRIVAAAGPFVVGYVASQGTNALSAALDTLFWVSFIPLLGLCSMPLVLETKGQLLTD